MRKVILCLLMVMIMVVGCGKDEEPKTEIAEPVREEIEQDANKEPVEEVVEDDQNEPPIDFQSMIPDPKEYFLNTEFEAVTEEDGYTVWIDYVEPEEWNAYIDKCKELGIWTRESYRSDYAWYVDSDDEKYELMLDRYGDGNKYMTIIINVKEEEPSDDNGDNVSSS